MAFIYLTTLSIVTGAFFIRTDWPFGFDGAYLSLFGLGFLMSYYTLRYAFRKKVFWPGLLGWCTLLWGVLTAITALVSAVVLSEVPAGLFFLNEMILVIAFMLAGYLPVYNGARPEKLFWLVVLVGILSAWPLYRDLESLESVRRVMHLGSRNYMAASYGATLSFCLVGIIWAIAEKNHKSLFFALTSLLLLVLPFFLAGSRSVFIGVFLSILVSVSLFIWIHRHRLSAIAFPATGLLCVMALIIVVFSSLTDEINLDMLFARYSKEGLKAGISGRTAVLQAYLPDGVWATLFGDPSQYALFPGGGSAYPHNLVVSSWLFAGLPSVTALTVLLTMFCFQINRLICTIQSTQSLKSPLMLLAVVVVLLTYSMASGHMTRSWHLFWALGLLAGSIDRLKAKKARLGANVPRGTANSLTLSHR